MNSEDEKVTSSQRDIELENQEISDSSDEVEPHLEEKGDDEVAESADDSQEIQERAELLQDQLLRAQAEIENVRRRSAKEGETIRKFAIERLSLIHI